MADNAYSTAGDRLRNADGPSPESGDSPQDKSGEAREDTFFLPKDYPGAADMQPGDVKQIRVVGKTADGDVEVECIHDDDEEGGGEGYGEGGSDKNYKPMMQDMEESL